MSRSRVAPDHGYHHGDLRRALLAEAALAIDESGAAALSLRELARRVGVSHAAPAHHFGDKRGLLTAVAVEGYGFLAEALEAAEPDFLEMGLAYVRSAVQHPAHFSVMFAPALHDADAEELVAARARTRLLLYRGGSTAGRTGASAQRDAIAAWSIVHGFVTLWSAGALPAELGDEAATAARPIIRRLFENSVQR